MEFELPVFSGEIRDFPPFIGHFKAVIKANNTHPADAAYFLKEAVPRQFDSIFDDVDFLNYDDMMSAVTKNFGSKSVLTTDALNQIEKMEVIQSDEEFLEFVGKLERIKFNMSTIDCLEEISNFTVIGKLENMLPSNISQRWVETVIDEKLTNKSSKEMFTRLMSFLDTSKEMVKYFRGTRKDNVNFVTGIANPTTRKVMMDKVASELRKLRGIIYRKIKRKKPEEELYRTVQNYMVRVDKFVNKFRKVLTKSEKKIWQNKKSQTYQDILDYCADNRGNSQSSFENIPGTQDEHGSETSIVEDFEARLLRLKFCDVISNGNSDISSQCLEQVGNNYDVSA